MQDADRRFMPPLARGEFGIITLAALAALFF
jgi:hypothetical protein